MAQRRVPGSQRSQLEVRCALGDCPPPQTRRLPSANLARDGYQRGWFSEGRIDHCPLEVLKVFTRAVASVKSPDCWPPTKINSPVSSSVRAEHPCVSPESCGKLFTRSTGSKRTGSRVSWQKRTVPSAKSDPELVPPNVSGEVSPTIVQAPGSLSAASVKFRSR